MADSATNDAPTLAIGGLTQLGLGARAETQASLSAFEKLMGFDAAGVLGFADEATPARSLARVTADAPMFADMDRPVNWAVPLAWPGIDMTSVASGAHDDAFLAMAESIAGNHAQDLGEIYVRPGWEATNAYPWKIFDGPDKTFNADLAQDYIDAFQHVVTLFRSVDDRFRFEWNQNYSNMDANRAFYELEKIYPGDDYVDVVGVDAYNVAAFSGQDDPASAWAYKAGAPYGLNWFSDFAASHGKPLAMTEWGIDSDNFDYYVDKLAEFARTNNVIYSNYWNADARTNGNDTLTDGSKPATAAAIAKEFGADTDSSLLHGKQSGPIVEAGMADDGSPLVGTRSAVAWAVKGDADAGDTVTFDPTGWQRVDSTHLSKNGVYGSVVLDTATGELRYTLDNARAATNALSDNITVTDAFSVTVRDSSGEATTQQARFTITGTDDSLSSGPTLETQNETVAKSIAEFQAYDSIVTVDTARHAMDEVSLKLKDGGAIDLAEALDGGRPARVVASSSDTTIATTGGNDTLIGGAGDDTLRAMAGNDTIDGRGGADAMHGGAGDDTYYVDDPGDRVVEAANQGTDTVRTGFTHTLAANVEDLVMLYAGDAAATGNSLDNRILGNSGDNVLRGMAGDDILFGGEGIDTMHGGAGDDLFILDNPGDKAVELAGQGTDTVRTGFTHTLAANIERLELQHDGDAWGTGNGSDNELIGNSGDNVLRGSSGDDVLLGGAGNDRLDGGSGVDSMFGGTGNDVFLFDNASDEATEYANQGVDTVRTGFTHALATNIENLELINSGNASGTGNASDNQITGNAGDNILKGLAGDDRINGSVGADTISGGAGNDVLFGGAGADRFVFDAPNTAANADVVIDFDSGTDSFLLDRAIFSASPAGQLAASAFVVGEAATSAAQRVIFDDASGDLFYDPDGTGGQDQSHFATLTDRPMVTSDDFFFA